VVSQSAVEVQSAAELLCAVAARAPQSAWRQFLAERRAVDCEGCCRPNGIVETLQAELRLLPLYAILAKSALPCSSAPSNGEPPNDNARGEGHEPQVQDYDSMHCSSASLNPHNAEQAHVQNPDDLSSNGAAETAALAGQSRQEDALRIESLCMLMLMVPTAAWHSVANAQVQMWFAPRLQCPHALQALQRHRGAS